MHSLNSYFGRQVIYLCCALIVFLALLYFDYHLFADFITFIYFAGLGALALCLSSAWSIHGNKSWIDTGLFSSAF